jgi:hypothetical protein
MTRTFRWNEFVFHKSRVASHACSSSRYSSQFGTPSQVGASNRFVGPAATTTTSRSP